MEILRTDSIDSLFEKYVDLKYVTGNWMRAANRIDTIVDNHINADPIENRDYIVELRYRYDADIKAGRPFSYTTEFIYHEDDRDGYCWLNDWYEGQQDIDVMRIIAVDDIDQFEFIECDPLNVTAENYVNIFEATIQSWMKKHEMYTDVIVRIAYKLKDDDEIKIRNEFLEFNGNECIFEWTHKWIPENLEFFYITGIIDPDDIERYTTVYTNPDDTSYREMIRNVSAPTDIVGVYRRLDATLKKFATENDCMGEELIVLWTHVEDGQYVLRKDVFHLLQSTLWDAPDKMYQVPGEAFAEYQDIMIWAIRPLSKVKEFDHWFVSTHNYCKPKMTVPIQTGFTDEQMKYMKDAMLTPLIDAIQNELVSQEDFDFMDDVNSL